MAGGRGQKFKSNQQQQPSQQSQQGVKYQDEPPKSQTQHRGHQSPVDNDCPPPSKGNGRPLRRATSKQEQVKNETSKLSESSLQTKDNFPPPSNYKQNSRNSNTNGRKFNGKDGGRYVRSESVPTAMTAVSHRKNNHGKIKHSPECLAAMQMRFQKLNNLDKIAFVPVPMSFFKSNIKLASRNFRNSEKENAPEEATDPSTGDKTQKEFKVPTLIYERSKPVDSSSRICGVQADTKCLTIYEKSGSGQHQFPLMQV